MSILCGTHFFILMKTIVYIDPQSGSNLAQYDYNLLININANIIYCCNDIYDAPIADCITYKCIFHYSNKKNNILKGLSYVLSLIKIFFLVRSVKPDIVHIQWWRVWFVDYLMLSILKKYCNSIVFTAHNITPHDSGDVFHLKLKKYYQRVDKIIVHAARSKKELVISFGINPGKIYVIPHGLLRTSCDQSLVSLEQKKLVSLCGNRKKLVFSLIGSQNYYKGIDLFYDAYIHNPILCKNENIMFIVAGKGDVFCSELMKKYENLLVYDSYISNELLEAILNITDVEILPYRRISQSGVLLSAIAKGIPYIATNVGGLSEPISIAPVGWLLETISSDSLSDCLCHIISSPHEIFDKQNNLGAWSKIRTYYDWKPIGMKTMECYFS